MPTLGACFAAKSLEIREYNKQVKFEVSPHSKRIDLGYCWSRKI